MNVGPFQLPASQSGTLSRISPGTRSSVQTVSDVCVKCICSLDTSAFSWLEVLDDIRAILTITTLSRQAPVYLADDCCLISDSTQCCLQSADVQTCVVP